MCSLSIGWHTDLDPSVEITKIFPQPFSLTYVVTLSYHQLSTDLHVTNPIPSSLPSAAKSLTDAAQAVAAALPVGLVGGNAQSSIAKEGDAAKKGAELKFQALLHTYIRVNDAGKTKIKGLKEGLLFADKTKGGVVEKWEGGDLEIKQETDR